MEQATQARRPVLPVSPVLLYPLPTTLSASLRRRTFSNETCSFQPKHLPDLDRGFWIDRRGAGLDRNAVQ